MMIRYDALDILLYSGYFLPNLLAKYDIIFCSTFLLAVVLPDYQDRFLFKLICKDLVQNDKTVFYWHVKTWQYCWIEASWLSIKESWGRRLAALLGNLDMELVRLAFFWWSNFSTDFKWHVCRRENFLATDSQKRSALYLLPTWIHKKKCCSCNRMVPSP